MARIFLIGVILSQFVAAYAQTAAEYVSQGRLAFEQRNVQVAKEKFSAALALSPNDATANAFYAVTRLLAVTKTAEFHTLLDRGGLTETNRDLFTWSAEFKTNALGEPITAENLNANEVVEFLRLTVLPEVEGALGNLALIPQEILLNLTAAEAFSTEPVTMDYADFVLLRAGLEFARYFIYTVSSWNFDVAADGIRALSRSDQLDIAGVLRSYPQLLTISSTNDLFVAKQAFSQSIAEYMAASVRMRARATNEVRLFNLDASMAEDERKFRVTLQDIAQSLDSRVTLAEDPDTSVHAGLHFSNPKGLRELLPEFAGNDVIAGTLRDATFGNVIGGVEGYQVEEVLNDVEVEVSPRLIPTRLPASQSIGFAVSGVDGEPLYLLRSLDLRTWEFLGVIYPTNGVVTFSEPVSIATRPRYYRTAFGVPVQPVFVVAPMGEAALIEQSKTYRITLEGENEAKFLRFPAPGSYQLAAGDRQETGTYSGARQFFNTWTMTLIPAAGQPEAQGGVVSLEFTAGNGGTWSFVPETGPVESGMFVVSQGGFPGDDEELTGRTLRLSYPTGGGEKFAFTSATSVSYEDGVLLGTYVWSAPDQRIEITLSNGWMFVITIPFGAEATVFFREHQNAPGETVLGNYVWE